MKGKITKLPLQGVEIADLGARVGEKLGLAEGDFTSLYKG